jgi:hypothetical protein
MIEWTVIGYPRSGNSWLSRLLADAFQAPIRGLGDEKPMVAEERPIKEVIIYQTHTLALLSPQHINLHIARDPRGVVVSMYHYWDLSTIDAALDCLLHADTAPVYLPAWEAYVNQTANCTALTICYRDLHTQPQEILKTIAAMTALELDEQHIETVIARQSIHTALKHATPLHYPLPMHEKSLRLGRVGDWHNYLSESQCARLEPLVEVYETLCSR